MTRTTEEQIKAIDDRMEELLYMYGDSDKEMELAKSVNGYRMRNLQEKKAEIIKNRLVTVKVSYKSQSLSDLMKGVTKTTDDFQIIKGVKIIKEEEGHITIGYLQGREPITRRLPKDRIEIM